MNKIMLGSSTLQTSSLAFGCASIAGEWNDKKLSCEQQRQSLKTLEAALGIGITHFDLADIYCYGKAEKTFAQIWQTDSNLRSQIIIQTKCGVRRHENVPGTFQYDLSYDNIIKSATGSIERLGVEYLDLLVLHRPDPLMVPEEVAQAFDKLTSTGLVRLFGVSNFSPSQINLLTATIDQPLIVNQLQLSLAHCHLINNEIAVNDSDPERPIRGYGTLEYCRNQKISVQAWSPLGGGRLAGAVPKNATTSHRFLRNEMTSIAHNYGVEPTAVAVAWILRHPAKIQPILGGNNSRWLQEAAEGVKIHLTRDEWYQLFNASRGASVP